ncbi:MAG TPA: hypothetical protein VFH68_26265 [Polyangia bacterium]|nr:hypothetical protein [Polyangia bacterium]
MTGAAAFLLTLAIWAGTPAAEGHQSGAASDGNRGPDATGEPIFRAAVSAYDVRDFARAAELFESAYRISKAPAILFDLGQAHRAQGNCRSALDAYDRFLLAAGPADPLRERVQARRAELQACAQPAPPATAVARSAAAQPIAVPVPALVQLRPPAADPPRGARLRTGCIAAGATTGALGAVGLGLGIKSWFVARGVEDSEVWDRATQSAEARGKAYAETSGKLLILSGVAASLTAATCWLGWVRYR